MLDDAQLPPQSRPPLVAALGFVAKVLEHRSLGTMADRVRSAN